MTIFQMTAETTGEVGLAPRKVRLYTDATHAQLTAPNFVVNNAQLNNVLLTPLDEVHVIFGNNQFGIFTPIFTNGAITLVSPSYGIPSVVVNNDAQMVVNTNYQAGVDIGSTVIALNLPLLANPGDQLIVTGFNLQGWQITQNAGQQIVNNITGTTVGVTGSLSSMDRYDAVNIKCIVANTDWAVSFSTGSIVFA